MGFREECVASLLPPICNATGNARGLLGWCYLRMGENYYNKRPCSSKTRFCSSRCMESSLLVNWAYIFVLTLTLSMLLTSEPACSSLQVMSWFSLSYQHLMNGPFPCHVGFQILFCSLFPPTQKIYPVIAPCFLLGSLMVEPRTNSQISVLTGKVNQAYISR